MLGSNARRLVFAGSAATRLGKAVAERLDPPQELAPAHIGAWANGETRVQLQENVRGADVFIFQSFAGDVNDHLMELLLLVDAALRASAARITVVVPYLPYSKQEKKTRGREPIAAKLVANILVSAGIDRVVSVDLHERAIQGFYDIPFDHLTALGELAKRVQDLGYADEDCIVVAPDEGAMENCVALAHMLGVQVAAVLKRHPEDDPESVETAGFIGNVAGKRAIIWDDMILGGSTLMNAADEVLAGGAKEVCACITHGILCGSAFENLSKSSLAKLVVTDSTVPDAAYDHPKIEVASLAPLLAQAIDRIHANESISEIMPEGV